MAGRAGAGGGVKDCPFCDYKGPSPILGRYYLPDGNIYGEAYVIEPINPVTRGHVLVIPEQHVADAAELSHLTGLVFRCAAEWARDNVGGDFNLITSRGAAATQTVMHLHVHVVPRREGDGLLLPWSGQEAQPDGGQRIEVHTMGRSEPDVRYVPVAVEGPLRA